LLGDGQQALLLLEGVAPVVAVLPQSGDDAVQLGDQGIGQRGREAGPRPSPGAYA
jgi:hypothetical protein